MSNIRINSRVLSLWIAVALILGIFMGMPVSANAMRDSGTSSQLPAPGNPHWEEETGTAIWEAVPNSGKLDEQGYTVYYKWQLYRHESNSGITDISGFAENDRVRYGHIYEESTVSVNLAHLMEENGNGYYYFSVLAFGDGASHTDSAPVLSPAFHYTMPEAKLPTPTGLKWQWLATEQKYFGVWDNIFGDEFKDAEGFQIRCEDESGEIYNRLFTRAELIKDRDERGRPGAMLYLNNPNGKYRFKVQAVSGNLNQAQSSEWSGYSPWVEIYPTIPDNSGGSSGGGGGSSSAAATTPASTVQTSNQIKNLASKAKSMGETTARSRGTKEVTVKGSAWSQLEGLSFQHDTVSNGAVQVRVTINNPTALTQDMKVSAYVAGKDVERVNNFFGKHFSNTVRVVHFDQTGAWGQEVRIAAKFDLSGMDKNSLVFYSYDKATNTYHEIQKPSYSIDANGYTHFSTPNAGDIIVSNGALTKK